MNAPYPSTCPKCAKCRLYRQRRCKGLLDYQRRWCPEWITYGMVRTLGVGGCRRDN